MFSIRLANTKVSELCSHVDNIKYYNMIGKFVLICIFNDSCTTGQCTANIRRLAQFQFVIFSFLRVDYSSTNSTLYLL